MEAIADFLIDILLFTTFVSIILIAETVLISILGKSRYKQLKVSLS